MIRLHSNIATGRLASSVQSIEFQLLNGLLSLSVRESAAPSAGILELYEAMRENSTFGTAWQFPKCSEISRKYGKDMVVKLLSITLADFSLSVQSDCQLLPAQITSLAEEFASQYPYESYREFVVAFKEVRSKAGRWKRPLTRLKIKQLLHAHFERRAEYLEKFHRSFSEIDQMHAQRA